MSQNEEDESEYEISPKFRELYKEKHDEKEIEKYIAERKKISRESSSPYHELSAWNWLFRSQRVQFSLVYFIVLLWFKLYMNKMCKIDSFVLKVNVYLGL